MLLMLMLMINATTVLNIVSVISIALALFSIVVSISGAVTARNARKRFEQRLDDWRNSDGDNSGSGKGSYDI